MKSLRANGTELWYLERGAGAPLLLVHGFPLDHAMWAGQLDLSVGQTFLSASGHARMAAPPVRMIVPDLRGFGRSPAGGGKGDETVTMVQFADDLAALLDGLGIAEPVVLCGLSMGGYIALQFWRKYRERLRGLVLCDTRAAADTPEAAAARLTLAERVLREGPAPLVEIMLPRLFGEATRRQRPDVVEGLRRVMMATDPRGIAAAARGMAERPDMTGRLGRIACPTLLIVGQHDAISPPAEMRGIAEAIPGAKFVEIPAAGHMSPLENPAAVNAALAEFLSSL